MKTTQSTVLWAVFVGALTLVFAGCGEDAKPPVTIVEFPDESPLVTVDSELAGRLLGEDGVIGVSFVLRDSGGDRSGGAEAIFAGVRFEFAKASDLNFEAATPASGSENPQQLESSPSGREYTFLWDAAADLDGAAEVVFRIVPTNTDGGQGTIGTSSPFIALNDAPALVDPEVSLLGAGLLKVAFRLSDSTEDPTSVRMQIVRGDNPLDVFLSEPTFASSDPDNLSASRGGSSHALLWDLRADRNSVDSSFQIALTPIDAFEGEGEEVLLGPFDPIVLQDDTVVKENIVPTSPAPNDVIVGAAGPAPLEFILVGPDGGEAPVRIETVIEGVNRPITVESIVSHDDPDATELELDAMPTAELGARYTVFWSTSLDIVNDEPDAELTFAVTQVSTTDEEEVEVAVPVRIDGNANPTGDLFRLPDVVEEAVFDLTVSIEDVESNLVNADVRISFDGGETFGPANIDPITPTDNLASNTGTTTIIRWRVQEDVVAAFGGNLPVAHAALEVVLSDGSDPALSSSAPLRFGPFSIDVNQTIDTAASALNIDKLDAVADLDDEVVVTVALVDEGGQPVPGELVSLDVSGEGNAVAPLLAVTDLNGEAELRVSSRRAEVKTIRARINPGPDEVFLDDQAEVTFEGDPANVSASLSRFGIQPGGPLPADGDSTYTITVIVVDGFDNPVPNTLVRGSTTTTGAALEAPSAATDETGRADFEVTSTAQGFARFNFVVEPEGLANVPLDRAATVLFVSGAPARLSFLEIPTTIQAGEPVAVLVGFEDTFGNRVEGVVPDTVTLSISQGPDGATLAGELEVDTRGDEAIFAVGLDKAGLVQLQATSLSGFLPVTSQTLTVVAGPPARLSFQQQPGDTAAGLPNVNTIEIVAADRFGNPTDSLDGDIALSLGNNPVDAALIVAAPDDGVDGVVRFEQVIVDTPGVGFTLLAVTDGIEPAESDPFDVGLFLDGPVRGVNDRPIDLAVGDFNGNGGADILVANGTDPGAFGLFVGNGEGTFTLTDTEFVSFSPVAIEAAQMGAGPGLDAVMVSYDGFQDRAAIQVFTGLNDGTFTNVNSKFVQGRPTAMAQGQLDEDGFPDFVVSLDNGALALFRGTSAATVRDAVIAPISEATDLTAVVVVDLDDDGIADILAADNSGPFGGRLWILQGTGNLGYEAPVRINIGADPRALAVADFNDDEQPDLVVLDESGATVLVNSGNGALVPLGSVRSNGGPSDVALGDFDGDDTTDIAIANRVSDDVLIFVNDGFGNFEPVAPQDVGNRPGSLVVADFDGDGALDLVVSNEDSDNLSVLLNASPQDP